MTKRFGRNQKRKMKAEIDSLNKTVEHKDKSIKNQKEYYRGLERAVEETTDILGAYFAGLPPKDMAVADKNFLDYGLRVVSKEINLAEYTHNNFIAEKTQTLTRTLDVLRLMPSRIDEVRDMVHFKAVYGREPIGYAIDRETIKRMPKHISVDNISRSLADFLVKEIGRV